MKKLGVGFSWRERSLENILAVARCADQAGVESVWIPEAWGRDAFLALAAVAQVTNHVKLATGIVNVYSRSPATLAMGAATLSEVSHGRAVLGVGSSGPGVVERWHGIRYERPLTRVRETVNIVRLALSGSATNFQGQLFQVNGFRLAMDGPSRTIPIYIAALGPKMLGLAGGIADGVLLYLCPLAAIPSAINEVRKGAAKAGRSLDRFDVAASLPTAISENRAEAREMVARVIAYYVGGMGEYYRSLLSRSGFESDVAEIMEKWQRGDRASATKAVSQRLIDSVSIAGSPEECRDKLREFRNSGVTLPILLPSIQDGYQTRDVCEAIKTMAVAE